MSSPTINSLNDYSYLTVPPPKAIPNEDKKPTTRITSSSPPEDRTVKTTSQIMQQQQQYNAIQSDSDSDREDNYNCIYNPADVLDQFIEFAIREKMPLPDFSREERTILQSILTRWPKTILRTVPDYLVFDLIVTLQELLVQLKAVDQQKHSALEKLCNSLPGQLGEHALSIVGVPNNQTPDGQLEIRETSTKFLLILIGHRQLLEKLQTIYPQFLKILSDNIIKIRLLIKLLESKESFNYLTLLTFESFEIEKEEESRNKTKDYVIDIKTIATINNIENTGSSAKERHNIDQKFFVKTIQELLKFYTSKYRTINKNNLIQKYLLIKTLTVLDRFEALFRKRNHTNNIKIQIEFFHQNNLLLTALEFSEGLELSVPNRNILEFFYIEYFSMLTSLNKIHCFFIIDISCFTARFSYNIGNYYKLDVLIEEHSKKLKSIHAFPMGKKFQTIVKTLKKNQLINSAIPDYLVRPSIAASKQLVMSHPFNFNYDRFKQLLKNLHEYYSKLGSEMAAVINSSEGQNQDAVADLKAAFLEFSTLIFTIFFVARDIEKFRQDNYKNVENDPIPEELLDLLDLDIAGVPFDLGPLQTINLDEESPSSEAITEPSSSSSSSSSIQTNSLTPLESTSSSSSSSSVQTKGKSLPSSTSTLESSSSSSSSSSPSSLSKFKAKNITATDTTTTTDKVKKQGKIIPVIQKDKTIDLAEIRRGIKRRKLEKLLGSLGKKEGGRHTLFGGIPVARHGKDLKIGTLMKGIKKAIENKETKNE